jgi:hypothetical protein
MTLGPGIRLPRKGTARRAWATGNDAYTYLLLHGNDYVDKSLKGGSGSGLTMTTGSVSLVASPFAIGGTAYSFGGASTMVSPSANADFVFAAGDFTVEMLIKINAFDSSATALADVYGSSNAEYSWLFQVGTNGSIYFQFYYNASGNTVDTTTSAGAISLGVPYHVAFARDSNTGRIYVNGVQVATSDLTGKTMNASSLKPLYIGYRPDSSAVDLNGWIQEVRISKGICRYPNGTAFTPPTQAFGPDAR